MSDPVAQTIVAILAEGKAASVAGFGVFVKDKLAGATGTNPRTGEQVRVEPKVVVFFSPAEALRWLGDAPATPVEQATPATVDVECRLSELLSLPAQEAHATLARWIATRLDEIRAADASPAFPPNPRRSTKHELDLGALGVLEFRSVLVPEEQRPLLGPSHRRFHFHPSSSTTEALGLSATRERGIR